MFLFAKDYRTMASGLERARHFSRYRRELVWKPTIALRKSWGGCRRTTLSYDVWWFLHTLDDSTRVHVWFGRQTFVHGRILSNTWGNCSCGHIPSQRTGVVVHGRIWYLNHRSGANMLASGLPIRNDPWTITTAHFTKNACDNCKKKKSYDASGVAHFFDVFSFFLISWMLNRAKRKRVRI